MSFIVWYRKNRKRLRLAAMISILLLAGVLRFWNIRVGYDQVCLLPREELWLYDNPQPASLYHYDASPIIYGEEKVPIPYTRIALPDASDLLAARIVGAFSGIVTVALMLGYGWLLRHPSAWLGALFIAVAPWFVWVDQWVIRFDFAALAVAVSIVALTYQAQQRSPNSDWLRALVIGTAFSLLLIAPPLWWLTLVLFLLELRVDTQKGLAGRWALFFVFVGILFVPSLRSPMHWLNAALVPDLGTTAALIWAGIALLIWRWRQMSWPGVAVALLAVVLSGGFTVLWHIRLPQPSASEWELVDYLQAHIPDGSIVRFDATTWHLVEAAQCPAKFDVQFTAQPQEIPRTYIPGIHLHPPEPDYIVMPQSAWTGEAPWVQQVGTYTVARMLPLPHATDILFGDLVRLAGYEVLTPQIAREQIIEIRVDLQFAAQLNERILAHALFVHITRPNQPGNKIINISLPFMDMLHMVGSRRLVQAQRLYALVPPETPVGVYDVLVGIYNVYDGKGVGSAQGGSILIGQIEVIE